jgi:flagellar protein FliS
MVSGYQVYQQTKNSTLSKPALLIMVFDGIDRFLNEAIIAIDERDIMTAHNKLIRVQEIIGELVACIDASNVEMASNLEMIYEYCYSTLVEANIQKNKDLVIEVRRLLSELGDGFRQANMM